MCRKVSNEVCMKHCVFGTGWATLWRKPIFVQSLLHTRHLGLSLKNKSVRQTINLVKAE